MTGVEIIALVGAAVELAKLVPGAVRVLKQSGELTPEQEAELDRKIAELNTLPHWRVDP
jgi:hypothetical protein